MSDLQTLLGGTQGTQQDQGTQDKGQQGDQKGKRKAVKPDWVKRREEATGITANFSDAERRWVFPGLSTNMGGPKKGTKPGEQGGPMTDEQVAAADKAPPTLDNAQADFLRGAYQESFDKLEQLAKTDPKVKTDPKYMKLRKHVDIELNM